MSRASVVYAKTQTDDPANRHPEDFYPTPPSAVRALLWVEPFRKKIWEPACGTGDMVAPLRETGHIVFASDLIDRGHGHVGPNWDFLTNRQEWPDYDIVTNPPFDIAQAFVDKALEVTRPHHGKVAMFLRLAFLEGRERCAWFPTIPLARVYVMSARVKMQRGRLATAGDKGGTMAFAWFIWEHGHKGPPALHFLDWKLAEARIIRGK